MKPLGRAARDPYRSSAVVLFVLIVVGFVAMWFGWRGLAPRTLVAGQVPYLLSGGLAGLMLVAWASAISGIQHRRRAEAAERERLQQVIEAAHDLVVARRAALAQRAASSGGGAGSS